MPESLPKVSIVTPSFNQGRFIEATIQSILAQDYAGGVEYLVVDGKSTDNTLQVLCAYEGRIRFISEKDQGQSDAVNKGFAQTSGDIIAWVNSDDTLLPNAVSAAVEYLQSHPDVSMVYGNADFIDANGDLIRPCAHIERFNKHRLLHYSDFIVQPAVFMRRAAFEAVGGLDPSLHYAMDYDLWLKLMHRFPIAYLPKLLAHYRWLGDNKSARGGWDRLREVQRVARHHGAGRLPAFFRLEQINLLMQEAFGAIKYGDVPMAAMLWAKAIGSLLSSPRAIISILSPFTWRIIHTGRVLRRIGFDRQLPSSFQAISAVASARHGNADAEWVNVQGQQSPIAAREQIEIPPIEKKPEGSKPITPWDTIGEEQTLAPGTESPAPAPAEQIVASADTAAVEAPAPATISPTPEPAATSANAPEPATPRAPALVTPADLATSPRITLELTAGPILTGDPDSGFSTPTKPGRKRNPFFVETPDSQTSGNGSTNGNGQH